MTTNPMIDLNVSGSVLYMAIELSSTEWKLAFADSIPEIPAFEQSEFAIYST